MAEPREFTLDVAAREAPVMMQLRACAVCGYIGASVGHMVGHGSYHEFVPTPLRSLTGPEVEQIKRLLESPDRGRVFSMLSPTKELAAALMTIETLAAALRGLIATKHLTKREWLRHKTECRATLAAFDEGPHAS